MTWLWRLLWTWLLVLSPCVSVHASAPVPPSTTITTTSLAPAPRTVHVASGYGCAAARAYLAAHANPSFAVVCPGYAQGHQAMTCWNMPYCRGQRVIVIAVPCEAAYRNEAANSWVIESGRSAGDPYGRC